MAAYLIRRLLQMIPTLLGVVLLVFFLFKFFGSDPAEVLGGMNASSEQIEAIREQLGLNKPIWEQLRIYLGQIITFDWGKSWATGESVANLFKTRMPATLTVTLPILFLEVVLAIPFAMAVAYRRGSLTDRAVMTVATVALSVSLLVYVILAQYFFAFRLGWFPVQGWSDSFWTNLTTYAPLPILIVVAVALAPQIRLYRSFFLDEIGHDYVRTARAKGLSEPRVLTAHVLRNALIPIVTSAGGYLPYVFLGSLVFESFFGLPGLGAYVIDAIGNQDFAVVRTMVFLGSLLYVLSYIVIDIAYTWIDPRVRLT